MTKRREAKPGANPEAEGGKVSAVTGNFSSPVLVQISNIIKYVIIQTGLL